MLPRLVPRSLLESALETNAALSAQLLAVQQSSLDPGTVDALTLQYAAEQDRNNQHLLQAFRALA